MSDIEALDAKARSESAIRNYGGRICDWLPYLERGAMRTREETVGRALILNALLNIYFKAPTGVIADWIVQHQLETFLSENEQEVLKTPNEKLSQQQLIDLYWYIEALWALMWVGQIIDDLPFYRGVDDVMASLSPNLQKNDGPEKFTTKFVMRDRADVFAMLDLHYRLHWWTFDAHLKGEDTSDVSLDIIMERRRALEWVMNESFDWDCVPMNT